MLEELLNLTSQQKQRIAKDVGPLRSISEFCSDLLEATKEIPLKEKLVELLPWAAKSGEILSEVTPITKVLVKLMDELAKERDPEVLGLLACSLAYQRSAALALVLQGEPRNRVPFEHSLEIARSTLKGIKIETSLTGFSLDAPLAHPFVWQADDSLAIVVLNSGYAQAEWRQIQGCVHSRFQKDLIDILAHGETASRFEPFRRQLELHDSTVAFAHLNAHIERQRRLFENTPVLNIEPFTLSDVYVDTDCGKLRWKDFPDSSDSKRLAPDVKFDPFSEKFGGRYPLLETVLEYLGDPQFNDAVVIQGAAGCGKSSFTLRLANALRREGLRPLRIRLKFLNLKKNLSEALANVVMQPEEEENPDLERLPHCSDPFMNDSIFQERTQFREAEICPYVVILDGWDEISVAVNEGFEIEVHRMLKSVREQFLRRRAVKVRVLVTGRPSAAVERAQFLRDETPVLTIREYNPIQLKSYATKVKSVLDRSSQPTVAETWPNVDWKRFQKALAAYEKSYKSGPGRLEILGLPLLAHLSLKLLVQMKEETEVLLSNPTSLYRRLLDLTCAKAGKASSDSDDLLGQARIKGSELRELLQQTATAMSVYGNESIPFRELQLRLKKNRRQTMEIAEAASKERPLTNLMISFYFKGGREHLGCEFLHKSFREYLYAEAIVELLKEYSRKQTGPLPKRSAYWRDFDKADPRWQFSRDLSRMLSSHRLTQEVRNYVVGLLEWEIEESTGSSSDGRQAAQYGETDALGQWRTTRDGLEDLWDWWGEGIHLRPQPYRDDSDNLCYTPALVNELLDNSLPRDRSPDASVWWPGRLVNADANVGDALCQLNAWIHFLISSKDGWKRKFTSDQSSARRDGERPYGILYRANGKDFTMFRPTGNEDEYFRNYCSRINASGKSFVRFPSRATLRSVDLSGASLEGVDFSEALLDDADLQFASLTGALFVGASLAGTNLREAFLSRAVFISADLDDAQLRDASLEGADFRLASLRHADLSKANLVGADLSETTAIEACFREAILHRTSFQKARLPGADFREASLIGATLRLSDLSGADFRDADLQGADLSEALLYQADFRGAQIQNANFTGSKFKDTLGLP
jgi:uncharacterized protein YjbI with pentapeptide repeats/KaiC/GvpD/RAD55 family RecA-like ATPase